MMMPPPPADLGAPPGGGPPPTDAKEPGPRGNVPEASNERRPGLKYNAAVKSSSVEEFLESVDDWPEDMRKRAAEIWPDPDMILEIRTAAEEPAKVADPEDPDDPQTWTLTGNQEVVQQDGKDVILEGGNRFEVPAKEGRRYSLIDPLAEALEDGGETSQSDE